MNQEKRAFEEASLTFIAFAAEDVLTNSMPVIDEDGNIVLPPVAFD